MRIECHDHKIAEDLRKLSLENLRQKWSELWKQKNHPRIGRAMLEKSQSYKIQEQQGKGLTSDQHKRLEQLIKQYKRNPNCFDKSISGLKPGARLVRNWNGVRHSVLIQSTGYEYKAKIYSSLSQIAFEITGTRWNGWVFFGLKKKEAA